MNTPSNPRHEKLAKFFPAMKKLTKRILKNNYNVLRRNKTRECYAYSDIQEFVNSLSKDQIMFFWRCFQSDIFIKVLFQRTTCFHNLLNLLDIQRTLSIMLRKALQGDQSKDETGVSSNSDQSNTSRKALQGSWE